MILVSMNENCCKQWLGLTQQGICLNLYTLADQISFINPFKPNGISHFHQLDESILKLKVADLYRSPCHTLSTQPQGPKFPQPPFREKKCIHILEVPFLAILVRPDVTSSRSLPFAL